MAIVNLSEATAVKKVATQKKKKKAAASPFYSRGGMPRVNAPSGPAIPDAIKAIPRGPAIPDAAKTLAGAQPKQSWLDALTETMLMQGGGMFLGSGVVPSRPTVEMPAGNEFISNKQADVGAALVEGGGAAGLGPAIDNALSSFGEGMPDWYRNANPALISPFGADISGVPSTGIAPQVTTNDLLGGIPGAVAALPGVIGSGLTQLVENMGEAGLNEIPFGSGMGLGKAAAVGADVAPHALDDWRREQPQRTTGGRPGDFSADDQMLRALKERYADMRRQKYFQNLLSNYYDVLGDQSAALSEEGGVDWWSDGGGGGGGYTPNDQFWLNLTKWNI